MKEVLVTGGGGFVGGNFVRLALREKPRWRITVFDSLTGRDSAPVLDGLQDRYPERFAFVKGMVTNQEDLDRLFLERGYDAVVHFAARNPSGRDAVPPGRFVEVNILGTAMLLEAARLAWKGGGGSFLHLSSYEVYGSDESGVFTEESPLNPSTPYAASKASADQFTLAYHRTFGMRTLVTRTTNIYGPYQTPDKLIPSVVGRVVRREAVPLYGAGANTRDWIHVDDHNRGVLLALEKGEAGRVYHLGARNECTNLALVKKVVEIAAEELGRSPEEMTGLLKRVPDRQAHDARHALDPSRAERELGFAPRVPFEEGLASTVRWLLAQGEHPPKASTPGG